MSTNSSNLGRPRASGCVKRLCNRPDSALVGALLALACCAVDPSDLGGGDGSSTGMSSTSAGTNDTSESDTSNSSGSTENSSGSQGSDTSTTETSESGTGVQTICEPIHACAEPQACGSDCGGRWAPQEANGCALSGCDTSEDCPDGLVCDRSVGWGGCGDKPCYEEDGACICPFGLDCPVDTPGICRSADVYPPPGTTGPDFCDQYKDTESCNAVEPFPANLISGESDRCRWLQGVTLPPEGSCGEATAFERCMFVQPSPEDGLSTCSGDASIRTLVSPGSEYTVLRLDEEFWPVPLQNGVGWVGCDVIGSEDQCECVCP